ncbi:PREDICTED: uncharacterized protein LOC104805338 [Tarenaya hassleriana]|uniref:uncharacterized protein LOC104805338 n=1 Tax=Tarenaya hassleriana TaxID=28532 RepID=UPI00053C2D74|nr:PREDICTED: uncharacterized protein LOC104805338 [Tarenaya hassleriana]
MDKDELWRTLRCAGMAQYKATVDTLMLRYRPIAPKPTTGEPCIGSNSNPHGTSKRTKRKYVRVSKNNKNNCRRKGRSASDPEKDSFISGDIVTLQLLPEKSNLNDESTPMASEKLDPTSETITVEKTHVSGTWVVADGGAPADTPAGMRPGNEIETWVTVESVTGACDYDGGSSFHALGRTDEEIVGTLHKDTCPGFISDFSDRVVWVNEAYRRTISGDVIGGGRESPEVVVRLVTDEMTAFRGYRSFTCRARLQYTWQDAKHIKTVPCDVWRMEFGGFAWRLDTRAALTLWL